MQSGLCCYRKFLSALISLSMAAALLLGTAVFSGCALPVPIGEELNGFVPSRELQLVSLAREGMAFFNSSRFFEAEARFRKALYLDPTLDNIRFNLATTLERIGQYTEAVAIYRDLIRKEGQNPAYHTALGRLEIARLNYDVGRKEYYNALSLANRDADFELIEKLNQSLITLEFSVGRIDEAICLARERFNKTRNEDNLAQYLRLLVSSGQEDLALNILDSNSDISLQDSVVSIYLRSLIFAALGKDSEAGELSERLLSGSVSNPSMEFELKVINLNAEYTARNWSFLKTEENVVFIQILSDSLNANPLTSLYWSPRLVVGVRKMLDDQNIAEILED